MLSKLDFQSEKVLEVIMRGTLGEMVSKLDFQSERALEDIMRGNFWGNIVKIERSILKSTRRYNEGELLGKWC